MNPMDDSKSLAKSSAMSTDVRSSNDETFLHIIAKHGSLADLNDYIRKRPGLAYFNARKVDKNNLLALEIIKENPGSLEEIQEMRHIIRNMILKQPCLRMSEKVSLSKKILYSINNSHHFFNDAMLSNLYLLCEQAANYAREKIKYSSAHPDANALKKQNHNEILYLINQQRYDIAKLTTEHNPFEFKQYDEKIATTQMGNCYEYTLLVANFLLMLCKNKSNLKNIFMYLADFVKGDHVLLFLTKEQHYERENNSFVFPGNTLVAIDAFTGVIYHPSELQYLQMHNKIDDDDNFINVLIPYDPRHHLAYFNCLGSLTQLNPLSNAELRCRL